jgi:DNA-binding NarL/FixJ family response regulator
VVRNTKPPGGLRGSRLEIGGETYVVLSYPERAGDPQVRLTPAEREVIALALEGWTSAAIAAARGSAKRTVDKQLEAAYRKLGVSSRAELAARYARHR